MPGCLGDPCLKGRFTEFLPSSIHLNPFLSVCLSVCLSVQGVPGFSLLERARLGERRNRNGLRGEHDAGQGGRGTLQEDRQGAARRLGAPVARSQTPPPRSVRDPFLSNLLLLFLFYFFFGGFSFSRTAPRLSVPFSPIRRGWNFFFSSRDLRRD